MLYFCHDYINPGKNQFGFELFGRFLKKSRGKQQQFRCQTGLLNFKKHMAILILALANYLLNIVSLRGPTMFGAGMKILGFGVPRWAENAFPSLVPWIYQCAKAPHFLYYVPQNIHSFLLKKANSFASSIANPNFCHI